MSVTKAETATIAGPRVQASRVSLYVVTAIVVLGFALTWVALNGKRTMESTRLP